MTKYICGWCNNKIEIDIIVPKEKGDVRNLKCPECARLLPSSRKEMLEGGKHIHHEWKSGDTII